MSFHNYQRSCNNKHQIYNIISARAMYVSAHRNLEAHDKDLVTFFFSNNAGELRVISLRRQKNR